MHDVFFLFKVLDVVLTIFRDGGSKELNVPVYPDMNSVLGKTTPDMLPGQCVSPYTKRKQLMQELQNQYGLWCEALYRLSLANHVRFFKLYL